MSEIVKFKFKISRVHYPKSGFERGDWASVACELIQTINGKVKFNKYGNISLTGNLPSLDKNEVFTCLAEYNFDPTYGAQYESKFVNTSYSLDTPESQKIFLSRILTENQVNSLFEKTSNPIELLEKEDVQTLSSIKGIGVKTASKLIQKYQDNLDYSDSYIQLDKYGLTNKMIEKLLIEYGSADIVASVLDDNPYLLTHVNGIGWARADEIALANGFTQYDPKRIRAFIIHTFDKEAEIGNSFIEPNTLLGMIKEGIGNEFDRKVLSELINEMYDDGVLYWDENKTFICLKRYYELEYSIANELLRIKEGNTYELPSDFEERIKKTEKSQGWEFTEQQISGIKMIVKNNLSILTGGAGAGKSSAVLGAINAMDAKCVAQTALSGKAASRMQEITGLQSYTIHRLLGFENGEFIHNRHNPLPYDLIFLDEASMIGGFLFYLLIQAIPSNCRLVIIGDTNQLESIGELIVLKDMIDSKVIAHSNFTEIHRQAKRSAIITESRKVSDGSQLIHKNWSGVETRGELQDFVLHCFNDRILTLPAVISYFKEEFNRLKDIDKIQILTCRRDNGDLSAFEISNMIQEIVNPRNNRKQEIKISSKKNTYYLREGDKVMVYKNNYKALNVNV